MKKKKTTPSLNTFLEGPLANAEKRVEDFTFNLYFSYCFTQSVKQHQELNAKYMEAWLAEDYDRMSKIDKQLTVTEAAFEATACMLDALPDSYS